MEREYFELDVFGTGPFTGNPVAVVMGADDFTTEEMQAIASWTNFSETTFVLTPTDPRADYRVRIFSPYTEFPFAGHPTLGTARAWREAGGEPQIAGNIVQECAVGLVEIQEETIRNAQERKETIFSFATPDLQRGGEVDDADLAAIIQSCGLQRDDVVAAVWGDNGPGWIIVQLKSAAAVREVKVQENAMKFGLVGFVADDEAVDEGPLYEVRAFTGTREDPVTGSLNGAVAQWLRERDEVPEIYTAMQGSQVGRAGLVHVYDDGANIWIGGAVDVHVRGTMFPHANSLKEDGADE
ncbi:PhzF family phenazine biosynthesis protein [Corynebacterium incognita]|uniref:PhzF family phenazine biosynthesis protein n=1 Tax=Corynebacterium incognita TaxID=2754725 RepID=A0A7G7CQ89_9CORY|nr:PhzF family phenazine biosynthesis protein [Corynebacterium incognita]QNE89755.1 PhzF family phenazine biosynthesis protein [Corynebacterium incognita]